VGVTNFKSLVQSSWSASHSFLDPAQLRLEDSREEEEEEEEATATATAETEEDEESPFSSTERLESFG
jgi:hypothetical protein